MPTPRVILLSICLLSVIAGCSDNKKQKILFLGDSITYAGDYITYIETYFRLEHPQKNVDFINLGLPSETVSGLSEEGHADNRFPRPDLRERFDRVMQTIKPDVVYACYGMNDGIYLPFDSARFNRYKEGILWLHNGVENRGAKIIHITPPVYDEARAPAKNYGEVLERYADWLIEESHRRKWALADLHFPMKRYLEEKRRADSSFYLAKDGVHPASEGHWVMATSILKSMGENLKASSLQELLGQYRYGEEVFKLVDLKQKMMKDAYLTATKHLRPEMHEGLPLEEAIKKADSLERVINDFIR